MSRYGQPRLLLLLALALFIFGLLWFRLFEKQVLEHKQYAIALLVVALRP